MTPISKVLPLTMALLGLALPVHSQTAAPTIPMHPPITGMQNHPPVPPQEREGKVSANPAAKFTHFRVGNKNV